MPKGLGEIVNYTKHNTIKNKHGKFRISEETNSPGYKA